MSCNSAAAIAAFLLLLSLATAANAQEALLGLGMSRTAAPGKQKTEQAAEALGAAEGNPAEVQQAVDAVFAGILQAHNKYRRIHGAQPLAWSEGVAAAASSWAAACKWGHPTISENGQNIAAYFPGDNPSQSLERAITDWYNEVNDWDFDTHGPKSSKPVLHFTQVVWRRTKFLGCAVHHCTDLVRLDNGQPAFPSGNREGDYVVCEYSPAGNYDGDFANNVLPAGSSVDQPGDNGGGASPVPSPSPEPPTPEPAGKNFVIEGGSLRSGGDCLISTNNKYKMCLSQRGQLITKMGAQVTWRSSKRGPVGQAPYQLVFANSAGATKPDTVVVKNKNNGVLATVVKFTRTVTDNINRPVALVLGDDGALYVWERGNCLKMYNGRQAAC